MLALMPPTLVLQAPDVENRRIEALIRSVEGLKGAVFIRNGSQHDAKAAADHLRLKWKKAGDRVKTAPDFIRVCGSGSSVSGQPYKLRLRDGREVLASDFFWTELKRLDATTK